MTGQLCVFKSHHKTVLSIKIAGLLLVLNESQDKAVMMINILQSLNKRCVPLLPCSCGQSPFVLVRETILTHTILGITIHRIGLLFCLECQRNRLPLGVKNGERDRGAEPLEILVKEMGETKVHMPNQN